MACGMIAFVVLFAIPMATIISLLAPAEQLHIILVTVLAVVLVIAAPQLPRLLRRMQLRRVRRPDPGTLAGLAWPSDLTRAELETHCIAWLRAHGWVVTLATHADPEAPGVYIMASRAATVVGVMCDEGGEDFNPAIIRIFAQESRSLGANHPVLLTLARGTLPHPAEAAARHAGVRLLRVTELPQLDALAPPETTEVLRLVAQDNSSRTA